MEKPPPIKLVGYARVSAYDNDLVCQREALLAYGVAAEDIIEDRDSAGSGRRKLLHDSLRTMSAGDTLVVWKLAQLGRSLRTVLEALERLSKKGANLVSITEGIDTTRPRGRAFLDMITVMAEVDRDLSHDQSRIGLSARKSAGKKFGRSNLITDNKKRTEYLRRLDKSGLLRDKDGELLMPARILVEELNKNRFGKEKIKSPETVRRWKRMGYPGID